MVIKVAVVTMAMVCIATLTTAKLALVQFSDENSRFNFWKTKEQEEENVYA